MWSQRYASDDPENFKNVMSLIQIMLTISMSTAVVERGFSHINILNSSIRTQLGNATIDNLLEVKINGPFIEDFSPATAIMHWLENGPRKRHIGGHKTKEKE